MDVEVQEVDADAVRHADAVKHEVDEAVALPEEAVEETPLLEVPRSTLTMTRPSQAWHNCHHAPPQELKEPRIPSQLLRTPREVHLPIYSLLHPYQTCNASASRSYHSFLSGFIGP